MSLDEIAASSGARRRCSLRGSALPSPTSGGPARLSLDQPIIRGWLGVVGAAGVERLSILRVVPFGAQPIGIRR